MKQKKEAPAMKSVTVKNVSCEQDFHDEVLNSPLPVILAVVSDECPFCLPVLAVLEGFAVKMQDHVRVVTIDPQANDYTHELIFEEMYRRHDINSMPVFLFYEQGKQSTYPLADALSILNFIKEVLNKYCGKDQPGPPSKNSPSTTPGQATDPG